MAKEIYENALAEAFPAVDAGVRPFGSRVLVQLRTPRKISKGGIHLSESTLDTEKWNTQVAKIVALGPVAFKNRTTPGALARRGMVFYWAICSRSQVWWRQVGNPGSRH
jgi:hypothetical protein